MALTDYDRQNLSSSQQAAVEKATSDWNAAYARGDTAGMTAAHNAAEAARNSAGYKSDSYGNYSGSTSSGSSSSSSSRSSSSSSSGGGSSSRTYASTYNEAASTATQGSGGVAGDGYTGSMKAITPSGQTITVNYVNGVMQNKDSVPDGTIVQALNGQNYVYHATAQEQSVQNSGGGSVRSPSLSPLTNKAPDLQSVLDKWLAAAQEQAKAQADYAVEKGVTDLQRAEEDARQQFQTERNQIAAAQAKASDNQALYNERRGDRGGIGAAQYDSIANTAAQNQLAVNQAQVKLSTDTARQIADLRAQGEFEKADKLLQLSQTYLQQLINIQQWASEFNLSVDQFNKQLEQWNNEFELKVADLIGNYRGASTLAAQQLDLQRQQTSFDNAYKEASLTGIYNGQPTLQAQAQYAEAAIALAQAGIMPSESQLQALYELYGYEPSAVESLVQTARLAQSAKLSGSSGSSGGSSAKSGKEPNVKADPLAWLAYHGYTTYDEAYRALVRNGIPDEEYDNGREGDATYYAKKYVEQLDRSDQETADSIVAQAAADYLRQNPTALATDPAVNAYLAEQGFTERQKALFREYIKEYRQNAAASDKGNGAVYYH